MTTTYTDGDLLVTTAHLHDTDLANERDRKPINALTDQLTAIADSARTAQRIAQTLGLTPTIDHPDDGCWFIIWSTTVLGSRTVLVQSCMSVGEPELETTIELAGSAWEDEYTDVQDLIDALTAAQEVYSQVTAEL